MLRRDVRRWYAPSPPAATMKPSCCRTMRIFMGCPTVPSVSRLEYLSSPSMQSSGRRPGGSSLGWPCIGVRRRKVGQLRGSIQPRVWCGPLAQMGKYRTPMSEAGYSRGERLRIGISGAIPAPARMCRTSARIVRPIIRRVGSRRAHVFHRSDIFERALQRPHSSLRVRCTIS